jgi:hypothetical protein
MVPSLLITRRRPGKGGLWEGPRGKVQRAITEAALPLLALKVTLLLVSFFASAASNSLLPVTRR